jgi:presenilin-like A22 family membrane protease
VYIYDAAMGKHEWHGQFGKCIGGIAAADIDDDGIREIAIASSGSIYIIDGKSRAEERWWDAESSCTAPIAPIAPAAPLLGNKTYCIAVADINTDGYPEVIVGTDRGYSCYTIIIEFSFIPFTIAVLLAAMLTLVLFKFPEWWVVDIIGVLLGAGVCAIIGISLAILPALILLIGLAVYDAIAVYKTKHMVDLADSVLALRLPILLVIPKKWGYSFLRQKGLKNQLDKGEERDAMFMGLGDIIIPGVLVVSALTFLPADVTIFGFAGNFMVAVFTLIGTLGGFAILMRYVLKGKPQAGLPLLNAGTIIAYFISYYFVYQDLTFGIIIPF